MNAKIKNPISLCVAAFAILLGGPLAFGQQGYEVVRKGSIAYVRAIQRPTLIDRLANTSELVELSLPEYAELKAYLVATSRPRRLKNDRFYQFKSVRRHAQKGEVLVSASQPVNPTAETVLPEDPVNVSRTHPDIRRAGEWERLRMQLIFNEQLRKVSSGWGGAPLESADNNEATASRKTVAVQIGSEVRWFAVRDCPNVWNSQSAGGGSLYLLPDGRCVLLTANSELTGNPATFVSERDAVVWLATQGHEIPAKMAQVAPELQLRLDADQSLASR
jgi:hypothetical protein